MQDRIPITEEQKDMLSIRLNRIELYRRQMALEEMDLNRLLRKIYGIDAFSEKWELDVEGSVLRRVESKQPE